MSVLLSDLASGLMLDPALAGVSVESGVRFGFGARVGFVVGARSDLLVVSGDGVRTGVACRTSVGSSVGSSVRSGLGSSFLSGFRPDGGAGVVQLKLPMPLLR